MRELPFERAAMRGDEMPRNLSLEDMCAYQFLLVLYERYYAGKITREQAAAEKGAMLYEYDKRCKMRESQVRLGRWSASLRNAIQGALNNYTRERTLENADALINAVDGFSEVHVE